MTVLKRACLSRGESGSPYLRHSPSLVRGWVCLPRICLPITPETPVLPSPLPLLFLAAFSARPYFRALCFPGGPFPHVWKPLAQHRASHRAPSDSGQLSLLCRWLLGLHAVQHCVDSPDFFCSSTIVLGGAAGLRSCITGKEP